MYILGVNMSHHPSVALLKDGELIFYLEDDRLNRQKEKEWQMGDRMQAFEEVAKYTKHIDHIIFVSFVRDRFFDITDYDYIENIKSRLESLEITYNVSHFNKEHHLYHATNAFYSSEFKEAAALVLDGGGKFYTDWIRCREQETMWYFSGTDYECIRSVYGGLDPVVYGEPGQSSIKIDDKNIISCGLSCGWIFNLMGWTAGVAHEAGKVMGLSPYGEAEKVGTEPWFKFDEKVGIWITDNKTILDTIKRVYNDYTIDPQNNIRRKDQPFLFEVSANLAKKAQEETEKHTIRLIQELIDKTNTNNVVLSGGYFLNCVNNYKYVKKFPEVNFFIDPCAHDGGTSIGGARYVWHNVFKNKQRYPLKSLFLG